MDDTASLNPFMPQFKQIALPEIKMPVFEPPQFVKNAEEGLASKYHERLTQWISEFDRSLDTEHEVGVRLVSFGQSVVFHLQNMGYWDPFLISFTGTTEEGEPVELIQHVSQISILLSKLPRRDPSEPKQPFGFHVHKSDD